MANLEFRINKDIVSKEIRLIDENGEMLGIMSPEKALNIAKNKSLDLIEVSPNTNPPVCKIGNYGKMRYQNEKKMLEAKKRQKVVELKEIKLSVNIAENDYNTKLKQAKKFFDEGNKVKFSFQFRGREINYKYMAEDMIKKLVTELEEYAKVDGKIELEGKKMFVIMESIVKK